MRYNVLKYSYRKREEDKEMRRWIDESTKAKIERIGERYGATDFQFDWHPYCCSINGISIVFRGFFDDKYVKVNPINPCPFVISTSLKFTSLTECNSYILNLKKAMQFVTALQPLAEEWYNV